MIVKGHLDWSVSDDNDVRASLSFEHLQLFTLD
jgi:hypothetical protein